MDKSILKLGFIPLTDCAPLVIAQHKGMFEKRQLNVELVKEVSWANVRDKVATGVLDGAQMLASMPVATSLGIGGIQTPMITALVMDLNGNAITVSKSLYERIRLTAPDALATRPVSAAGLKKVIDEKKSKGDEPLRFATVFPTSTHTYELRYWLASAGIDPDHDLELIVIPPVQMVENLASGNIDGFCVGEPWNSLAVNKGLGHSLITKYEIWNNSPEKVFGVTEEWARINEDIHIAIIQALVEASKWLDESPANRQEAASILSQPQYVDLDAELLAMSMTGTYQYSPNEPPQPMRDFNVFYRHTANFPWHSHAAWFISQMIRWGHIRQPLDIKQVVSSIYRTDIYRQALDQLDVILPENDYKSEGEHKSDWSLPKASMALDMGADCFFDGQHFDPEHIAEYIASFRIRHPAFDLTRLV